MSSMTSQREKRASTPLPEPTHLLATSNGPMSTLLSSPCLRMENKSKRSKKWLTPPSLRKWRSKGPLMLRLRRKILKLLLRRAPPRQSRPEQTLKWNVGNSDLRRQYLRAFSPVYLVNISSRCSEYPILALLSPHRASNLAHRALLDLLKISSSCLPPKVQRLHRKPKGPRCPSLGISANN